MTSIDRPRAARSVLWSLVENGGLALVSMSSLVIYSRFLSAADFGLFSIVLALIELLDVLVSMLFHDALVQKEIVTRRHFDTAFTFTMGLAVALCAACAVLSSLFGRLVHNAAATPVLAWSALRLPCTALGATIVAQQRRDLAFRTLALRSLVGRLVGAALGIALVVLGARVWGLVAQQILISLTGSLVLWFAAGARLRLRFAWHEFRQLVGFGAYSLGSLFLNFSVKRVFIIVSGVMIGNVAAGYLNLSFRAVDVLWAIAATAVSQVALPILARLHTDPQRRDRAYRSALELVCLTLYPCFVGMAVVAPELVTLLFGPQWLASSSYVSVLALLILVQAPRLLIGPMLTAMGRPRETIIGPAVEMVSMLALFAALRLGLGRLSISGAVAIWAGRELLAAPVMALVLQRLTRIPVVMQVNGAVVPLLASATMAAAVLIMRQALPVGTRPAAALAALVATGAATFLFSAWLIGRPSLVRVRSFVASAATRVAP